MLVYNINYDPLFISTQELLNYIDTRPEVLNWYKPFNGTVLIVSNKFLPELSKIISLKFPGCQFLLTQSGAYTTGGMMNSVAWDFINKPKSSGRWDNSSLANLLAGLNLNK